LARVAAAIKQKLSGIAPLVYGLRTLGASGYACFGAGLLLGLSGGGIAPFAGAAAAGVWMAGYAPWPALLGNLAAALLTRQHGAACAVALYGGLGLLWLGVAGNAKRVDKLLLLAAGHLLTLPLFFLWDAQSCLLGLSQLSLAVFGALVVEKAALGLTALLRRRLLSGDALAALCALCAMLAMAGMRLGFRGVTLGGCIAAYAALCAAGALGIDAVAAAALLGVGVVLGGAQLVFVGSLALCTLGGAIACKQGRGAVMAGFLGMALLGAFYIEGGKVFLLQAALGAGLYLAMPPALLRRLRRSALPRKNMAAERRLNETRRRVREAASVLERVSELLEGAGGSEAELFAGRQLRSMCGAMERMAEPLEPAQPCYELSLGAAAYPKQNSPQTGDSMAMRECGGGQLLLLSDGMGTGSLAHRESAAAVALLGDLLSVGVEENEALDCVNRLLMLGGGQEMYATLDVLRFDPASACARFIKQGAPPSYILREGRVHMLHAETLPVGILAEAAPGAQEVTLLRGDTVVLMTDGLLDALGQELFAAMLERVGGANTAQDAAEALLCAASERGRADDMTVIVARVS
jgi:hypothetical protein